MTATYNSFPLSAGQDVDFVISVVDRDGAAVDLTGAEIRFVMTYPNDKTITFADTAGSPTVGTYEITDAVGGEVTVSLADTVTDNLVGDYYYEMKVTSSDGDEGITNRGIITFEEAVT